MISLIIDIVFGGKDLIPYKSSYWDGFWFELPMDLAFKKIHFPILGCCQFSVIVNSFHGGGRYHIENSPLICVAILLHDHSFRRKFNPLQPGAAFLYPLKTSENLYIVSSPLKLGGFLFLKFKQRGGSLKKLFRNRGVTWKGGFPNCFISFSSEKHVLITIGILSFHFLSGKYGHL